MKIHPTLLFTLLWTGSLASVAGIAQSAVTQQIEPARIAVGGAAQLTIVSSSDTTQPISPPMVAGLEFMAVGQSQRVESVNGITRSTSAVTYQVIPQKAGVFNIPGAAPGSPPLVLTVTDANGNANGNANGAASAAAPTRTSAGGAAFVRLGLPKHELYVGETIPVDIEVGTRDGMVASMNGSPVLNGDAFVLDKLSNEPRRSTQLIGGEPFTVFTWHSTLAAVKPGTLSLTMETPLTVRVRTPAQLSRQMFDNPDSFFDQANLQNLFGGVTDQDITVESSAAHFTVLALPKENQPADFSGAVGHFKVTSELTDDKGAVGDPLTLRLKIAGTGNFDRVTTTMLHDPGNWQTYAPTATFVADEAGSAKGVKTFEQPISATASGEQSVPSLSFSWFDPDTRHYETAHTTPLTAAITPATGDRPPAAAATAAAVAAPATDGLRPDKAASGHTVSGLRPDYVKPAYLAAPSLLVMALSGVLLWLWQRDREDTTAKVASLATEPLIKVMDDASSAGDAETFFNAARLALQRTFSPKWHLPPESINVDDVEAHFDPASDVARVFRLAEESAYAGGSLPAADFLQWKTLILRQIHSESLS